MTETTFSDARAHLARYMDQATDHREPVIVRRRGRPAVALIDVEELERLSAWSRLMAEPERATRILAALVRADRGEGARMTIAELRRDVGLDPD